LLAKRSNSRSSEDSQWQPALLADPCAQNPAYRPTRPRRSPWWRSVEGARRRAWACHGLAYLRIETAAQSSSSGYSVFGAKYRLCLDSRPVQRGHMARSRRTTSIADHSSSSLRRSSAWWRCLSCRAWVVQLAPSSRPMQISRTAPSTTQPSTCSVTALCGELRHDVPLLGHGLWAESWAGASRSGGMST
jgi:hypothetical protein